MATADLTILALGRPDPSASAYVAEIQRHLARQDKVRYEMHAMGTSLEGRTEDILAVVGWLHDVPFELGAPRAGMLLFLYGLGHSLLIVVAGTSVGAATALIQSKRLQSGARWVRRAAGVLILGGGAWLLFQ